MTITDKKFGIPSDTNSSFTGYYEPEIIGAFGYYPFGAMSRIYASNEHAYYRFGFNGKELDHEAKGSSNQYDYGERAYDPRIGRFNSVDPISKDYPELSSYQYGSNRPIDGVDMDGLEYSKFTDWGADKLKAAGLPRLSGFVRSLGAGDINQQAMNLVDNSVHGRFGAVANQVLSYTTPGMVLGTASTVKAATNGDKEAQGELMGQGFLAILGAWKGGFEGGYKKGAGPVVVEEPVVRVNEQTVKIHSENPNAVVDNTANQSTENANSFVSDWNGPFDYSHLKEPKKVGPYLETTRAQRARILEENKKLNNGILRSDLDGSILDAPSNVPRGGKANMNQAEVDHIDERAEGGSNSNSNQRVISKQQNLDKEMQKRKEKKKSEQHE